MNELNKKFLFTSRMSMTFNLCYCLACCSLPFTSSSFCVFVCTSAFFVIHCALTVCCFLIPLLQFSTNSFFSLSIFFSFIWPLCKPRGLVFFSVVCAKVYISSILPLYVHTNDCEYGSFEHKCSMHINQTKLSQAISRLCKLHKTFVFQVR